MAKNDIAEIGKYRILGQIGEGAMGVVYRALDPVLNRAVAIKVMSDALARDTDLRGRFLREAQSAGSLQHPNVITIYDFGEVDGHPFIAMEFVEGADLNEFLEKKTPLSLVEKLDVLIDVLNGLSYAHKRGIVHRDIKPANIRIDEEGRARVMDFGIAHLASSNMTRTGVMVGTPAYMCPEQITGGEVTPASDIFAVGAVMYELLTGVQAFRGESLQTVMYKIVSAPTPELKMPATGLSPDKGTSVTKALNAIVTKALDKDAERRYASALDMATALGDVRVRLLDDDDPIRTTSLRATVAKAMANTTESKARTRRNRTTMLSGAAAVLLVAVATAVYFARRKSEPPPAETSASSVPVSAPTRDSTAIRAAVTPAPAPPARPSVAAPTLAAPARSSAAEAPVARELSVLRTLQSTALDARRRAAEAGASAEQLSAGDTHNRTANSLALQGRTVAASDHFNQAMTLWAAAERRARVANTQVAQTTRSPAAEAPRPQPPAPAPAVPSAAVQQATAIPQAPTLPASNPAADIGAAVAAYARALESRDVGMVRRAYPGITPAQARGWEQFFGSLRTLRVTLGVSGLDVNGGTAEAKLVGTYDYVSEAGKATQQPVAFQAGFVREGSIWQLVSVH
jgi:serine/threonine protein kinase